MNAGLGADKASYIPLRSYKRWKSVLLGRLRGDKAIWEARATTDRLLRSGSKSTNMTLPAKVPYERGHPIVKVERAGPTEGERPVVGESSSKPRWQDGMRELEPSAVCSAPCHSIYDKVFSTPDKGFKTADSS
ncbi:hypothetical protein BV22DRAFT_1133594 [Leucogyrophana mollusca]|uniref:Uncharacterized protein n=1 Tax=Leucogyrophana mollusca TaxID=85980 RepID=A0ACB8B357_9AGAM|nr:hypothetical protein BV22DRAFT_1133594 [Leucogyrophana mollusca]